VSVTYRPQDPWDKSYLGFDYPAFGGVATRPAKPQKQAFALRFYLGDLFGYPAFFQKDRLLGAELMTAHTVNAVSIIEIRRPLPFFDRIGRTVIYANIAIDTVAVQNTGANPN
jgi:hypothetical protein